MNSFPVSLNQTNQRTCSVTFLEFRTASKELSFTQRVTTILFTQSPVYLSRTEAGTTVTEQKPAVSLDMFLLHYETQELHENRKNEKKFFPKERPKTRNFIPLLSSEPYINARGGMRKRDRKSEFMYCKVLSLLLPHPPTTRSSEPPSGSPPTFSLRLPFLIGHPSFK